MRRVIAAAIVVLVAVVSSTAGDVALANEPLPRVTLTVQITARGTKAYGRVKSMRGTCPQGHPYASEGGFISCGWRIKRKHKFRLQETPTNKRAHPFLYWILPNGKKSKHSRVTIKINSNSTVAAVYKSG